MNPIALQIQQPQLESPVNALARALQVRGMQQEQDLGQMKMDEYRRGVESQNALRQLYSSTPQDQLESTLLSRGYAKEAGELGKQRRDNAKLDADIGKTKAETSKIDFDTNIKRIEHVSSILSAVKGPQSYNVARQVIAQQFGPGAAGQLPQQYDPAQLESLIAQGMTVSQRMADERARQQQGETERHNRTAEGIQVRGQNMTDARSREQIAQGAVQYEKDAYGNIVALPKKLGAGPIQAKQVLSPDGSPMPTKKEASAVNALQVINEAEKLIDGATGSYAGAGIDAAARAFGAATPGAENIARLKALEGSLMMAQPRMEGPQSDKDVMLYRQMAAQIGDPTIPRASKKAALDTMKSLNQKYAGGQVQAPQAPVAPAGVPEDIAAILKKHGGK